jgi:hypothetical protein
MSRFRCKGIDPKTNNEVNIAYGYDHVIGFKPGYFFQVFSTDAKVIENTGDGCILNEGFLEGISKERLNELFKEYKC